MKKNEKFKHTFRDSNQLLKHLEKGTVSEFILDSIKLRLKIDEKAYMAEQATLEEQINFIQKKITEYTELQEENTKDNERINKRKKDMQIQLERLEKEHKNIKYLLKKQRELQEEELNRKRTLAFKTVINNILSNKEDSTIPLLNLDYLQKNCEYNTQKEFRQALFNYINGIRNDFTKTDIIPEDIDYVVKKITEIQYG